MKGTSLLNMRINGTAVYLRPVAPRDASMIRKWHNDPVLMRLARVGEKKTTLDQERADIRTARRSEDQAYHMILRQSDDSPIGFIRFIYIDRTSGNVWLRMMIGDKQAWGKGYAGDAMRIYLKWLFDVIGIHRVTLECYSTNKRAIEFYRRIGFRKEGVLREAVLIDGTYHDIYSFGLLRRDMPSKEYGFTCR
jgi:RimJ/RimL family protein N-acetyltransferase